MMYNNFMERQILESSDNQQEISLRLEHYDDIFSDFDIRPYSKRALSVDFLEEIKRAAQDKDVAGIDLVFHAPHKGRDESLEATIKERLSAHFKRHYHIVLTEKRKIMRNGISMIILGVIFMILATLIIFKDPEDNLLLSFLVVFLEPAAWFLLWEGMDQVLFNSKNINPELYFYKKMSHARGRVHFKSY